MLVVELDICYDSVFWFLSLLPHGNEVQIIMDYPIYFAIAGLMDLADYFQYH